MEARVSASRSRAGLVCSEFPAPLSVPDASGPQEAALEAEVGRYFRPARSDWFLPASRRP